MMVDETVPICRGKMMFDTDNVPLVLAPFGRAVTSTCGATD
jgi:hypothetical protein